MSYIYIFDPFSNLKNIQRQEGEILFGYLNIINGKNLSFLQLHEIPSSCSKLTYLKCIFSISLLFINLYEYFCLLLPNLFYV